MSFNFRKVGLYGFFTLSTFLFSACKSLDLSDNEMKGILTVDKAQYGNDKLEVFDPVSRIPRFIYPGRKILKIESGINTFSLTMMESGRAQLAKLDIPMKLVSMNPKENSVFIEGRKIGQSWNLKAQKVHRLLQIEYVPNRNSKKCQSSQGPGLVGPAWLVKDFRYDYEVHFINEVTEKDIGFFQATGEHRTSVDKVDLSTCQPMKAVYQSTEAFR